MTFSDALTQLIARVDLDRQALAKLQALAQALQATPALEDLLNLIVRKSA